MALSGESVQEGTAGRASAADVAVVIAALLSQFEKIRQVRDVWRFSRQSIQLRLGLGQPLEHDVLLMAHFEQQIFDSPEAVFDRLRDDGDPRESTGLTVRLGSHMDEY
jgi:hypothetical protein